MGYFDGQSVPAHKDTIMIHCLATSRQWGEGKSARDMMKEVTRWHTDPKPQGRGWRAVAYAAIVDYAGDAALGRDLDGDGNVLEETAAAARGWNTNAIHLAIAGGRGSHEHDKFEEHYTHRQDATLRAMILEIEAIAGRKMTLMGHNQVARKACPGFQVDQWWESKVPQEPDPLPAFTPDKPTNPLVAFFLALFGRLK